MRTRVARGGSRELLAVGIFGRASLGHRIEMLLKRGREFSPGVSPVRVGTSAVVLLMLVFASSLVPRWIAFAQQPDRPSFEVASVKLDRSGTSGASFQFAPGGQRFAGTNTTLGALILLAYKLTPSRLSAPMHLPAEYYDVDAKTEKAVSSDQMLLMLQALLADRFKLKLHWETKEMPVYALVLTKGGPKFRETETGGEGFPQGSRGSRGQTILQNAPLSYFAWSLSLAVDRPVVDRTGLTGRYDFEYSYRREPGGLVRNPQEHEAAAAPDAPSIFDAIQEQLGLKLEPQKGPVEILVVDHVERPDAN
jgi:uncharacterized protein (TIGR03435 family)